MSHIPFRWTRSLAINLFLIALQGVFVFPGTARAEDSKDTPRADSPTIDGTTGMPLGGLGTGAIKFCAHNGTFAGTVVAPCAQVNFQAMRNTCFQFFSSREGKVETSERLQSVKEHNRSKDDAVFPLQTAEFGTINGVKLELTAFGPFDPSDLKKMTLPCALFEIKLTNTGKSLVQTACALQLDTTGTPKNITDRGMQTEGGVEWAVFATSSAATSTISTGSDREFFRTGICLGKPEGKINRTAIKIDLKAGESQTVRFVIAWYNGADLENHYYANEHKSAGSVAEQALAGFEGFKNNSVTLSRRMRASNFPDWLKNQTLNSMCNLVNNSVFTKDGRYFHTEGQWSCNGTMDQMWHARQMNTLLVPAIAWQELQYWARTQKMNPLGQIHHDFKHPGQQMPAWDETEYKDYRDIDKWVDLNCAFIISVYEAFIATDDRKQLDYFWPYVKKAGQRVLDQAAAYGDPAYPFTFKHTDNSYDAGGNPDPFNASISIVAYRVMTNFCDIVCEPELKKTYTKAFNTTRDSFSRRYLSNNFPSGRIAESVMAGQWLAYCLKFGDLFPTVNLSYALYKLDLYYKPMVKGMGFPKGTYDEWTPYLISHYGGLLIQTGSLDEWRAMQHDMYERAYLNRNLVFNQPLDILPKVIQPNYEAKDFSGYNQYISTPVIWRNYYSLLGYHRNKHTEELWLEPVMPTEMKHEMKDGFYFSPEGAGTISYKESGDSWQNMRIVFKPDNGIKVSSLNILDKYGSNALVLVNGKPAKFTRTGTGFSKEIKIDFSGIINPSGIEITATGNMPETPMATYVPTVLNPFGRIEAEAFDLQAGVATEDCKDEGGGQALGFIEDDDFVAYPQIDFKAGAAAFFARVASGGGKGRIEVRLDSTTGPLVGSCPIENTGGWQNWKNVTCDLRGVSGKRDLYLVFKGDKGYLLNFNWFNFKAGDSGPAAPMQTAGFSAFEKKEAEDFDSNSGVKTGECKDTGNGKALEKLKHMDFTVYSDVDFDKGASEFTVRAASGGAGGVIEVRLDNPSGLLVGSCKIDNTGDWQKWTDFSCPIKGALGKHNLYLLYNGGAGELFSVNWFRFN